MIHFSKEELIKSEYDMKDQELIIPTDPEVEYYEPLEE